MPPLRIYHNLIRYKSVPDLGYYLVRGMAENNVEFQPSYDGYQWINELDRYCDYYIDNSLIDGESTTVYYYYDWESYKRVYFYYQNNNMIEYTPPKPTHINGISFNVKFITDGVIDNDFTSISCDISPEGAWKFTYPLNKKIYSLDNFCDENNTYYDPVYGSFEDYATHILLSIDFTYADRLDSLVSMQNAFKSCYKLASVNFNGKVFSNLTNATDAFFDCNLLPDAISKVYTAPNLIGSIGEYSFYKDFLHYIIEYDNSSNEYYLKLDDCVNEDITPIVNIPSSITIKNNYSLNVKKIKVDNSTFRDEFFACERITQVNIPNTIIEIGEYAFVGCTNLTIVNLGNSINRIGRGAFGNCSSLNNITLPNSLTEIGEGAFYGCSSLTRIVIPNSVTRMGWSMYDYSSNDCWEDDVDYDFDINNDYKYLPHTGGGLSSDGDGVGVFNHCTNLTSVTLSENIERIYSHSFANCDSLTQITFPNSLKRIGPYAFRGTSLTSLILPNQLTHIEEGAFNYTPLTINSLTIPNTVVKIDSDNFEYISNISFYNLECFCKVAFHYRSYLLNLSDFNENSSQHPEGVTINARYLKANNYTIVNVPNTITKLIGTFVDCDFLTQVNLPNTITLIDEAFINCLSLNNITLPNSLIEIGYHTFANCLSLTRIVIPNSVTRIGSGAFLNCSNLTEVYIPNSVIEIGVNAFDNANITIYCEAQQKPAGWEVDAFGYWNSNKGTVIWGATW